MTLTTDTNTVVTATFMTRKEMAAKLGISLPALRDIIKAGHIRTVPGRTYVHRAEFERYVREGAPQEPQPQPQTAEQETA